MNPNNQTMDGDGRQQSNESGQRLPLAGAGALALAQSNSGREVGRTLPSVDVGDLDAAMLLLNIASDRGGGLPTSQQNAEGLPPQGAAHQPVQRGAAQGRRVPAPPQGPPPQEAANQPVQRGAAQGRRVPAPQGPPPPPQGAANQTPRVYVHPVPLPPGEVHRPAATKTCFFVALEDDTGRARCLCRVLGSKATARVVGEYYQINNRRYQLQQSDLAPVGSAITWRFFTIVTVTEEVFARSSLRRVEGQNTTAKFLTPILNELGLNHRPTRGQLREWWHSEWRTPFPVVVVDEDEDEVEV